MSMHSDNEEINENQNNVGHATAMKMNASFTNINNIQNSPNFLKLIKYPDHMTYESMVYAVIRLEEVEEEQQDKKKEYVFSWLEEEEEEEEEQDKKKEDFKKITKGYPIQENEIQIANQCTCPPDSSGVVEVCYCNNGNNDLWTQCIGPVQSDLYDMDKSHEPSGSYKYYSNNPCFNTNQSGYFDFRNCLGISSSQEIIKNNTSKYQKLQLCSEVLVCNIEGNHDAISNVRLSITGGNKYDKVECVLKIDEAVICSKTIMIQSYKSSCTFISFPNLIVLYKYNNQPNKVSIYIRGNSLTVANKKMSFSVKYDKILFESKSRKAIHWKYQTFLYKTTSDVIICSIEGLHAVRYFVQLQNSVDPQFKHLYSSVVPENETTVGDDDSNTDDASNFSDVDIPGKFQIKI
jgi:hypothetical protein